MIIGDLVFFPHIIHLLFHRLLQPVLLSAKPEGFFIKIGNLFRDGIALSKEFLMSAGKCFLFPGILPDLLFDLFDQFSGFPDLLSGPFHLLLFFSNRFLIVSLVFLQQFLFLCILRILLPDTFLIFIQEDFFLSKFRKNKMCVLGTFL